MKRMFVSKCSNDFTVPCQMNDTVLNYCQRGEVVSIKNFSYKPADANKIAVQYSTIRIEMNNVAKTTRNYLCAFLSLISAYMLMNLWQISFLPITVSPAPLGRPRFTCLRGNLSVSICRTPPKPVKQFNKSIKIA